jgi:leucine dehydrogenase
MNDIFDDIGSAGAHRVFFLRDEPSGLRAIIALDDVTLGPACGGIRTQPYPTTRDALVDVAKLSSAMTLKCAIANLPAGGGKTVVIVHPGMNRPAAFRRLGEYIQDLGGMYRAAGDLGTTYDDLLHAAENTDYVDTTGQQLGEATGVGIVNCIRACATDHGVDSLANLTIAIQGCGLIGAGVARSLAAQGAHVIVADVDSALAEVLAAEIGGTVESAETILMTRADIISPCAIGGVLTGALVPKIQAWGICGGANNQFASPDVGQELMARDIVYVPDFLASSGAVIDGTSRTLINADPAPLLAALEDTALLVLATSRSTGRPPHEVAQAIARDRILSAQRAVH